MCSWTPMFIVGVVAMLNGLSVFIARSIELGGSGLQSPGAFVIWDSVQTAVCLGLLAITLIYASCYRVPSKFSSTYTGFAILATLGAGVTLQFSLIQYMRYRNRLTAADFAESCGFGELMCQAYNGSLAASEWRSFCAIDMVIFVVTAWAFVGVIAAEKQMAANPAFAARSDEGADERGGMLEMRRKPGGGGGRRAK